MSVLSEFDTLAHQCAFALEIGDVNNKHKGRFRCWPASYQPFILTITTAVRPLGRTVDGHAPVESCCMHRGVEQLSY